MKPQREICWNCCCRRAFTLVEVVASLMLLGTLLVGILATHRRHAAQIRSAQARLAAIASADKLLADWREQGMWGAAAPSGNCEGSELAWRWTVKNAPELRRVGAAIGRLEIVDKRSDDTLPLVGVEILVTDVPVPTTP